MFRNIPEWYFSPLTDAEKHIYFIWPAQRAYKAIANDPFAMHVVIGFMCLCGIFAFFKIRKVLLAAAKAD